jgi:hypothetical protein
MKIQPHPHPLSWSNRFARGEVRSGAKGGIEVFFKEPDIRELPNSAQNV